MAGNKNSGNRSTTGTIADFSKLTLKCHNYLLRNFHKFTDTQKIDIAKSVILKAMPQEPTGETNITSIIYNINQRAVSQREQESLEPKHTDNRLDQIQPAA